MARQEWRREEQLLALRLYCLLPFGQLHKTNKDVVAVADGIGRTPSAVAMKACNFASLDSAIKQRGLGNVSQSDRDLWTQFLNDSEAMSAEAEEVFQQLEHSKLPTESEKMLKIPDGPTESIQQVRVRRVQGFFRKSVLVSYANRCAISGLDTPQLIVASHIIPWSRDKSRRADPTNGIALNSLYDVAFDKGFMTFDEKLRVVLSKQIRDIKHNSQAKPLFDIEGRSLLLPSRFYPDPLAMDFHRDNVFIGS